jgi:hypothetical protein
LSHLLRAVLASIVAAWLLLHTHPVGALEIQDDPQLACDRAAATAERDRHLPDGLLAAIGTVESGRLDASGQNRRAWPWSINADGWSYFAASKTEALSIVRTLQTRGIRTIDVGCFQVDLFYHPDVFTALEEAFDPDANARAASHILLLNRFSSTDWFQAVALYHSASLLRGAWYLQKVRMAWPAARSRLAALVLAGGQRPQYAVLLSAEARLVRIVTAADPLASPLAGLPRVVSPNSPTDVPDQTRLLDVAGGLPRVVAPPDVPIRGSKRSGPL